MKTSETKVDPASEAKMDELLQKMIYLKRYEIPAPERMTRNKQNIMRRVRQARQDRWNLGDLLEVNMPWFFAEPRYGIAMLFIVFASLQFWGAQSHKQMREKTGIYSTSPGFASIDQPAPPTNAVVAPLVDENLRLFARPGGGGTVKFVGLLEEQK